MTIAQETKLMRSEIWNTKRHIELQMMQYLIVKLSHDIIGTIGAMQMSHLLVTDVHSIDHGIACNKLFDDSTRRAVSLISYIQVMFSVNDVIDYDTFYDLSSKLVRSKTSSIQLSTQDFELNSVPSAIYQILMYFVWLIYNATIKSTSINILISSKKGIYDINIIASGYNFEINKSEIDILLNQSSYAMNSYNIVAFYIKHMIQDVVQLKITENSSNIYTFNLICNM